MVLVIFVYLVYTASNELGSPNVVYKRLMEVAGKSRMCQEPSSHDGQACGPVNGNYKGSYLTMLSSGGLVFGIINIVGNFGTVFVDNVSFHLLFPNLPSILSMSLPSKTSVNFAGILGERHSSKAFIYT